MYEFKLPDLGEGIHEGEILKWFVKPGDSVKEDAPLCEVETDKAAVVVPSPVTGVVSKLGGAPGQIINTGDLLVLFDAAGSTPPSTNNTHTAATPAIAAPAPSPTPAASVPSSAPAQAGRVTPAAPAVRRLARELGVDINTLRGSGPGGRVLADDVRTAKSGGAARPTAPASRQDVVEANDEPRGSATRSDIPFFGLEPLVDFATQGPIEVEPLRSIRRKVARKMTTSMIVVPHVCHMDEIDVTELDQFRRDINARYPESKVTLMAFVMRALALTLKRFPMFNASLDPDKEQIVYKKFYNLGFATDTGKGLVVPVIKGAENRQVGDLAREIVSLASRAREGKLEASDYRGGTFTVTNIGALGGTAMVPTINYPEVAILGMARVQQKPVVRDGAIVIRSMLPVTLAFDHRVADGADAARFVNELARRLSNPGSFLLES